MQSSQPISMQSRRPEQDESVTSPQSAEGSSSSALGVHMVEYVLASSPGGNELETRMKQMQLNGELDPEEGHLANASNAIRKSPFEEDLTATDIDGELLQVENELNESTSTFTGLSGSRNQSPNVGLQDSVNSQLGLNSLSNTSTNHSSQPSSTTSGGVEDQVTSPIPFGTDGSQNTSGENFQQPMMNAEQMNQQNQQQFVMNQQQQMGIQMGTSPYFVANGQEMFNNNNQISIVNAQGQTAFINPQYAAAYGIQPYMYNGNAFIQQQPAQQVQQAGQVRTTTPTSTGQTTQTQQQGQQQLPNGYQVIQTPLSIPAGSTFYDQHGNPVIINGRIAAPMGQQMRMVSPVVLNAANGQAAVSPGMGTSPSMQPSVYPSQP
jgi:hypothetical protein